MKPILRKILIMLICLIPWALIAQEQAPKKENSPATTRMQRKAGKKKWKENRKNERENEKAIKDHHKRLQTKETRKRMRKERQKGEKMRANKKENFMIRWFKYK